MKKKKKKFTKPEIFTHSVDEILEAAAMFPCDTNVDGYAACVDPYVDYCDTPTNGFGCG